MISVLDGDGATLDEPVTGVLTDAEMADEKLRPEWVVERYDLVKTRFTHNGLSETGHIHKWVTSCRYTEGRTTLEEAIKKVRKRQKLRPDMPYRVRNMRTGDIILAHILL